jgi:hypothetical protein
LFNRPCSSASRHKLSSSGRSFSNSTSPPTVVWPGAQTLPYFSIGFFLTLWVV